jgi:hypothetical protein
LQGRLGLIGVSVASWGLLWPVAASCSLLWPAVARLQLVAVSRMHLQPSRTWLWSVGASCRQPKVAARWLWVAMARWAVVDAGSGWVRAVQARSTCHSLGLGGEARCVEVLGARTWRSSSRRHGHSAGCKEEARHKVCARLYMAVC